MSDGQVMLNPDDAAASLGRWTEHAAALRRLQANGRPAGEALVLAQAGIRLAEEAVAEAVVGRREAEAQPLPPWWFWLLLPWSACAWTWHRRRGIAAAKSVERRATAVLARENTAADEVMAACEALLRRPTAADEKSRHLTTAEGSSGSGRGRRC